MAKPRPYNSSPPHIHTGPYRPKENEVVISRPSPWGNPYELGKGCPRCHDVHVVRGSTIPCFKLYADERLTADPQWLEPLRGKVLLCNGCPRGARTCHARVIEKLLAETVVA